MKKFYNDFFYIPKHGKIKEKVMLTRIAISITLITFCLAAMSYSAYASFTSSVNSGRNRIKAAVYEITATSEELTISEDGTFLLDNTGNSAEKEFTFTITKSEDSTAGVGYCKIDVLTDTEDIQSFYTQPIGTFVDGSETPVTDDDRTVTIVIPQNSTATVSFLARWGSCNPELVSAEGETLRPKFDNIAPVQLATAQETQAESEAADTTEAANTTTENTETTDTGAEVTDTPEAEQPASPEETGAETVPDVTE